MSSQVEIEATGPIEQIIKGDYMVHELVAKAFAERGLGDHRFVVVERNDSAYSVIRSSDNNHLEDFERALSSAHQVYDSLFRQFRPSGFTIFEVLENAVNLATEVLKAQEERLKKAL